MLRNLIEPLLTSIINLSIRSSSSDVFVANSNADSWLSETRLKLIKESKSCWKMRTNRPATYAEEMGLGPKKTFLVLFTVVGCIAILFPKIFYPMLMGSVAVKDPNRGPLGKDFNENVFKKFNYFDFTCRSSETRETDAYKRKYLCWHARARKSNNDTFSTNYWTTWPAWWAAT